MFPAIRFLNIKNSNSTLNKFKPNQNENLDDTEKAAVNGLAVARDVLAVEDASEIAKSFIFEGKDVFEKIIESVTKTPYSCQTFNNRTGVKCVKLPTEILHIGYEGNFGGHYSAAVKSGQKAVFFDSMCQSEYGPKFRSFIKRRYGPKVKIVQDFNKNKFQPSGGFAPNKNSLRNWLQQAGISFDSNKLNRIHEISQYDVLSQHHFCYIEALVYLFHKILKTPIGPSANPEKRLRFIKSVMWCLIFKYANPNRNTHACKYFEKNFKYYIKLHNVVYNQHGFYLPTNKQYSYSVEKIHMMSPDAAKKASIKQIISYSLKA